jgi:hypothetical protein
MMRKISKISLTALAHLYRTTSPRQPFGLIWSGWIDKDLCIGLNRLPSLSNGLLMTNQYKFHSRDSL